MTVAEAGRRGGAVTAQKGSKFFSEIGKKGGAGRKAQLGREGFAAMGRKGGEKVSQDRAHMAAIGRMGGRPRRPVEASAPSSAPPPHDEPPLNS